MSLSLRLLGSPQIVIDGQTVTFESRKAVALLAYLVVQAQPCGRAALAAMFWPESDQRRARGALRYTLSLLRRELDADWIDAGQQVVALRLNADCDVDVERFRALTQKWADLDFQVAAEADMEACREQLTTAVALYRADFLSGLDLRDCPEFDEWVFFQAEALRQRLARSLELLVEIHAGQGEWAAAIDHARRWLQLDPYHEAAHRALMRSYAGDGQWAAALRQYATCTAVLEDELGVEPMPETRALYDEIRRSRHGGPGAEAAAAPARPDASGNVDGSAFADSALFARSRQILLDKVAHFWVDGVLEQAAPRDGLLQLTLRPYHEAIDHPWDAVMDTAVVGPPVPADAGCMEYYDSSDGALLIVGAAGSGKTLLLIQLARALLERARQDRLQPIPVILNLSTWAEQQGSLEEWVVQELASKYQIPRRLGAQWLDTGQLVLLLDGLDELPAARIGRCILTINTFRARHGLNRMVVCSRRQAYERAALRLRLNGALLIEPLTRAQMATFLENSRAHATLRSALAANSALHELARSPLTLSIITAAYAAEPGEAAARSAGIATVSSQSPAGIHQQLFDGYVRHMLHRRGPHSHYGREQTVAWLGWLAERMQAHNQTIFLMESVQPSWLPDARWRWSYMLFSRMVGGFVLGLIAWMFLIIGKNNIPGLQVNMVNWFAETLHLPAFADGIVVILLLNMSLGLLIGLLDGYLFLRRGDTAVVDRRTGWRHAGIVGLSAFAVATAFTALFDPLPFALFLGLLQGTGFILAFGYLDRGQSFRTEVRTVEALGWSWTGALKGLGVGVLFGALSGLLMWLLYGDPLGQQFFVGSLTLFTLTGGLRHGRLQATARPNEGIWLSARNGLIAAVVIGSAMTATFWLHGRSWPGWYEGVLFGLIAGLIYGGSDVLRHVTIRAMLARSGRAPWKMTRFLDFATSRILLRRVGGGYIFRHRLLQDYFAERD